MARRVKELARAPETRQAPPVWRVGPAGPLAGVRLGLRSAGRGWRLLTAVALGMVMTVTLLSVVPIYTTLVSNTQIAAELASAATTDRNMEVAAHVVPLWQVDLGVVDSVVTSVRQNDLPPDLFSSTTEYIEADRPFLLAKVNGYGIGTKQGQSALPSYTPNGQLDLLTYNYTDAAPHMKIFSGRLPKTTPAGEPPEVMVTPKFGAKPGMLLTMSDGANAKRAFVVKVSGVWYPKDENDPFWNGRGFDTQTPLIPSSLEPPPIYPVLLDRQAFAQMLSFPQASPAEAPMGVVVHYIWFVHPSAITVDNVSLVLADLKTLRNDLNGYVLGSYHIRSVSLGTHLGDILSQGQSLFGLLRLPLYSVAAQLVVMALLFIVTMVGLLIESQGGVIATLRSRGASMTQMLVSYLAQGIALAGVALVVGPPLAMALSLFVITTFVPAARAAGVTLTPCRRAG